jgi:hypothetical protein
MKSNLTIAFLILTSASTVFSQEIKFTDLAEAQRGEFTSYIGSDGA